MQFGLDTFRRLLPNKRFQIFALILFCALVTSGVLIATAPAHASISTDVFNAIIRGIVYLLLLLATLFIQLTIFLLKFFILIAGYNNYINAPVVLLGWNMVRDVANMFFVVILLVIAFGTILGLEQYEWRKSLVKLILAAILVNFSNLILQLIIDVAQVFMITFLNAVAGAAGGNLINMFNFDKILNLAVGNNPSGDDVQLQLLAAGVMALVFAAVAMFTMFAYIVVLVFRVVLLWVSIILSPLAFIFSVLPQTKSYADEFWKEFTNHVLAGPVMVFFLWLAFATFGGGGITQHLEQGNPIANSGLSQANVENITDKKPGASINEAASWENMANFIVAIAFLWVGIERVQKLGVRGGGLTSSAIDFGKKVATIGSGYAAGRWLVGKGMDLGGKGIKGALYHAPVVGGQKWETRGQILGHAAKGWYYGKGAEVTAKGEEAREKLQKNFDLQQASTPEGQKALAEQISGLEEKRKTIDAMEDGEAKEEALKANAADVSKLEALKAEAAITSPEAIKANIAEAEAVLKKEVGGGLIGRMARSGVALEKQKDKTVQQAEYRYKNLRKRTGSEAGGIILGGAIQFGMGAKGAKLFGIPLGKKFGDRYHDVDAQDRIERGWYQAEEARSAAKDREKETEGRLQVLGQARLKYNTKTGAIGYEVKSGSMAERIERHNAKGEGYESDIALLALGAREKMLAEAEKQIANIDTSDRVKGVKEGMDGFNSEVARLRRVIESLKGAQTAQNRIDQLNKHDREEYKNGLKKEHPELTEEQLDKRADAEEERIKVAIEKATSALRAQEEKHKKNAKENEQVDFEDAEAVAAALSARDTEKTDVEKKRIDAQKEYGKEFLAAIQSLEDEGKLSAAWKNARNKAQQEHRQLFYGGREKKMVDDAAQKHIWDAKGIVTPNNAELAITEGLMKDFQAMDYNAAVAAVQDNQRAMEEKAERGEASTFEDRAITMVLLKKLHADSWIDDAILPTVRLQQHGIEVNEKYASQINEQLERDMRRMDSGRASGSGRDMSGGGAANVRGMANVLKEVLGDGIRDLIGGVSRGTVSQQKLIEAIREGIASANPGSAAYRGAGLDATKTPAQLAQEMSRYLMEHHAELRPHV